MALLKSHVSNTTMTAPVQIVTFEAFRDLIKLLQLSISEETGIALADDENLEQRATAKSTAVGQYSQQSAQAAGRPAPGGPAGKNYLSAIYLMHSVRSSQQGGPGQRMKDI